MSKILIRLGLVVLIVLTVTQIAPVETAEARPGGGQSYSGGSSGGGSSGGGGGDGGGELIFWLLRLWFQLVFRYPLVGIPLTIVGVVIFFKRVASKSGPSTQTWDAGGVAAPPPPRRSKNLEPIHRLDPDFSTVLFEDFVYALFARVHQARSNPAALQALSPYVSDGERLRLAQRPPAGQPISGVVIGALRVNQLYVPADPASGEDIRLSLEFEANMSVGRVPRGGSERGRDSELTHYVKESWNLRRAATARSRPPDKVRDFGCPSCGAPFDVAAGSRCQYCNQEVADGRFDWFLDNVLVLSLEERPPSLTGTVPERGTDFPTVYQRGVETRMAELFTDDSAVSKETLGPRLRLIFNELNAGWTALDLTRSRAFVSDSLFEYLHYWIDAYKRQGLRNVLEGSRLTKWVIAKVERDKYFDAVTVRIWGSGKDSTVDSAGRVVGGNPQRDRVYSEYWTLIRGRTVRGAPRTEMTCPKCGAELKINMAGSCEYCDSKITRGEFDWVLSKIEQDDSYSG